MRIISNQLLNGEALNLELYVLLFERQKSTLWAFGNKDSLQPRTFILTNERILLSSEDYSRWPFLGLEVKASQFQLRDSRSLEDVVRLELGDGNRLAIYFEEESGKKSGQQDSWELVAPAEEERNKIVSSLSRIWKQLFRIDLTVEHVSVK